MTEQQIKNLKTAGKVAAWIIIPGGLAWAAYELYKRYGKSAENKPETKLPGEPIAYNPSGNKK